MKVVILAGGLGTRLSEETNKRPKPLVEIGEKPIIWHIMKYYSHFGHKDFIICAGYKSYQFKEYFLNYHYHNCNLAINTYNGEVKFYDQKADDWNVTIIDTGLNTMTGGRLKRIAHLIQPDENFFMTYGDGLSNVNLHDLQTFHESHDKHATVTTVTPQGRFGAVKSENGQVICFTEKPSGEVGEINGGFFVLNKKIFDYISGDQCIFERSPLENLTHDRQLMAYKHNGFWHPMDTVRDKIILNNMVEKGDAPWKVW